MALVGGFGAMLVLGWKKSGGLIKSRSERQQLVHSEVRRGVRSCFFVVICGVTNRGLICIYT